MNLPERTVRLIALTLGAIALLALILGIWSWRQSQAAAAREKLATEQRGAALQSGHDAVETLGNATVREGNITATVEEGTHEIEQAPAGNSNAAADRATCRLRSYRHTSRCVALLGPVAK